MSNDEASLRTSIPGEPNRGQVPVQSDEVRPNEQSWRDFFRNFLLAAGSTIAIYGLMLFAISGTPDMNPASRSDRLERERRAEELAAQIDAMRAEIAAEDAGRVAVTQPGE